MPAAPASPVFATADLCDGGAEDLQVAEPIFHSFGGAESFHGPIATVRCHEDNSLVRSYLDSFGEGRVLVVDGGGSRRCALLGDRLAALALEHGWSGVVIWGCVRDSAALRRLPLGIRALAAHPLRSEQRGAGARGIPLHFAGARFHPGHSLYADADGIVVSARPRAGAGDPP